jgi:hypothetical protein
MVAFHLGRSLYELCEQEAFVRKKKQDPNHPDDARLAEYKSCNEETEITFLIVNRDPPLILLKVQQGSSVFEKTAPYLLGEHAVFINGKPFQFMVRP